MPILGGGRGRWEDGDDDDCAQAIQYSFSNAANREAFCGELQKVIHGPPFVQLGYLYDLIDTEHESFN